MHTHRTLMHNAVGGQWSYAGGPEPVGLGVVPMFHITGMLYSVLGSVYAGCDRRPHAALGSRARRPPDLAAPHLALGLHPDDGDRPLRQPQLQELRPVEPAQHQRRRRGDAVRGRRAAAEGVRPDLRRRLRPHRDGRAEPRQPARARQAAVPRHPDLRGRFARRRSADAGGAAARRGRRDHHPRADGLHRLLEASGGDRGGVRRSSTGAASFAPATSAGWTRKATSSSPTG